MRRDKVQVYKSQFNTINTYLDISLWVRISVHCDLIMGIKKSLN